MELDAVASEHGRESPIASPGILGSISYRRFSVQVNMPPPNSTLVRRLNARNFSPGSGRRSG
jgi:hypothetical protein